MCNRYLSALVLLVVSNVADAQMLVTPVSCAPEISIHIPSKPTLQLAISDEMQGALWQFRSIDGDCYTERHERTKHLRNLVVIAISKPEVLSTDLCVMRTFQSEVDITKVDPLFVNKYNSWAIATAPCSEVTTSRFTSLPPDIQSEELPHLAAVLEALISNIRVEAESIRYEDKKARKRSARLMLSDIWMVDLRRQSPKRPYDELYVDFQVRPMRADGEMIGIVVKLKDWSIVDAFVRNILILE